jgi:hypothetical protein
MKFQFVNYIFKSDYVSFLLKKKVIKPNFFKKNETGSNRPVSVFLTKTGLARFFRCWLDFFGLALFFSVWVWFFRFEAYETEPVSFFQNFNRFFSRFGFFSFFFYFFGLIGFSVFLLTPNLRAVCFFVPVPILKYFDLFVDLIFFLVFLNCFDMRI